MYPDHYRNQWWDLVIAVMKLRILWVGNFMSSWSSVFDFLTLYLYVTHTTGMPQLKSSWTNVCFSGSNPTRGISYLAVKLV